MTQLDKETKLRVQAIVYSDNSSEEKEQLILDELAAAKEEGAREERERKNKYGRKYNRYPKRMAKSRHRYHVRINKKFKNCNLCKEAL